MNWYKLQKIANTFPDISEVFDNRIETGLGATSYNHDIDYFGFVKMMRPSEFRRLVPPGVSGEGTKDYVIQELKNPDGKRIASPWLKTEWDGDSNTLQIVGHEGRSRTDAIAEIYGDVPMPVHITVYAIRARSLTPEIKEAPLLPERY
jgi:hypothetical protein